VHLLGLVGLSRCVAHALAGDDVHDHRTAEAAGAAQRDLHRAFVVSIDRTDVLQSEIGEHQLRRQGVLDAGFNAVHEVVAGLTHHRHRTHHVAALLQHLFVGRLQPQGGQMVGDAADRRRVAAAVVVDHDDHRPVAGGDVVQRLPAHTAGERAIADHRDHVPVAVPGQLERLGQAVGVGQRRAGVAGLHPVVFALGARRVPGQAALLAQAFEIRAASGQHLVDVRLVTGVEDDRIVRRVEHPVQRQRELDDAEVRPQVPPGRSNLVDQELANLGSEMA
jgi:hypothetical protein